MLLDIFSRYVVGWMVADRENSALAQRLIEETCLRHGAEPKTLILHSGRGLPMTAQGTAQLLARIVRTVWAYLTEIDGMVLTLVIRTSPRECRLWRSRPCRWGRPCRRYGRSAGSRHRYGTPGSVPANP